MRSFFLAAITVAALSFAPTPSDAAASQPSASLAPVSDLGADLTLVSGGCGPRGFRAANGLCYPRRPPPWRYRRAACPPRFHLTPVGCRRNF